MKLFALNNPIHLRQSLCHMKTIQMVGQFDKRAWTAKTSEDSLLYLYLY